jgi:hypothetical protein
MVKIEDILKEFEVHQNKVKRKNFRKYFKDFDYDYMPFKNFKF